MALHGYYLEDLSEGMSAAFGKTVTDADVLMYAGVSGDTNPVHLNEEFALETPFHGRIAHGMLTAGLISTVFGTKLPGPGCIYVSQTLRFLAPVRVGETLLFTNSADYLFAIDRRSGKPKWQAHRPSASGMEMSATSMSRLASVPLICALFIG